MQELDDPWKRYQKLLESARSIKTSDPMIVDIHQLDGKMYCTQLWTTTLAEPSRLGRFLAFWIPDFNMMKNLGFSKEDRQLRRLCTEPNCFFLAYDLYHLVNHLHFKHKIAISQVGKLLPYIRADKREVPSYEECFRLRCKFSIERIKEFFRE